MNQCTIATGNHANIGRERLAEATSSNLAVQDSEGAVHLVERATGKIAGRGLGEAFTSDVGMVASGDGALIQTKSGQLASLAAR